MKLTNTMKDCIIQKILRDTFKDRTDKIQAQKTKLADRIYKQLYGKMMEQMAALPEGYFYKGESLYICFGEDSNYRNFIHISMSEARLLPYMHSNHRSCSAVYGDKTLEFGMYEKIKKTEDQLKSDTDSLERRLKAIIQNVNSDVQLLELWPDAKPYIPAPPARNLPMVDASDLSTYITQLKKAA